MPPKSFPQSAKQVSRSLRHCIHGHNRRIHGQHSGSAKGMEPTQPLAVSSHHEPRSKPTRSGLVPTGLAGLRQVHPLPDWLSVLCFHRADPAFSCGPYHGYRYLSTTRESDSEEKDFDPDADPDPHPEAQPKQTSSNPQIYSSPLSMRRKPNPNNLGSNNKAERFNWSSVLPARPNVSSNLWAQQDAAVDPWMDAAALESDVRVEKSFRKRILDSSERKKALIQKMYDVDQTISSVAPSSSSSTGTNEQITSSAEPIRKIYDKVLALDREIQQALWLTRVANPAASQDIDRRACFEAADLVFKKYRSLCQLCSSKQLELVKAAFGPDIHWLKQEAQDALRDRDPTSFF